ncbi:MAG: serine hydrolase domain-containing protein [Pseudobdellovibrionaceae bacterium]
MNLSSFERKLLAQIEPQIVGRTPGLQVQVHQTGRKIADLSVGDTYPYYDLASQTKIIFTVQALMWAFEEGKWDLETKISDKLSWFPFSEIKVIECLNHSSGLQWWAPFYEQLDLQKTRGQKWEDLKTKIAEIPLEKKEKSVYSDLGFLVLGYFLEQIYDLPLIEVWNRTKEQFYPRLSLDFHLDNQPKQPQRFYAPTERNDWRGKTLQGEVHDDNAWALGGVASHAGLFGSIDDVSWYGLFLRSQLKGISKTLIRQKTAQLFTARSLPLGKGDWALGYMMPTPGASTSGTYFSPYSIGHTGFTGTSFWYDPAQDLMVVILANRVLFGRDNHEFASLRPSIHNWVVEGLRRA